MLKNRGEKIVKSIKVKDILKWARVEGYSIEYIGDQNISFCEFSSLSHYKKGSLTWINLKNPVDKEVLAAIHCAIIQKGVKTIPDNCFIAEESKRFFFSVLENFFSDKCTSLAEREHSYIGREVKLGKNVKIGCNCTLDGNITIGDNTIIEHNVTVINKVVIGHDCIIHSGAVIGKDGFGYSFDMEHIPQKVKHFGGVRIGDRVEIGCNCSIDRGTIDDTQIANDVKIDSLVIIGHNNRIEEGVIIVGCTEIGGSCEIGEKSYIAPQAVIKNKTSIGKESFIGMGVVVTEDLDAYSSSVGCPVTKISRNKDYRRFL